MIFFSNWLELYCSLKKNPTPSSKCSNSTNVTTPRFQSFLKVLTAKNNLEKNHFKEAKRRRQKRFFRTFFSSGWMLLFHSSDPKEGMIPSEMLRALWWLPSSPCPLQGAAAAGMNHRTDRNVGPVPQHKPSFVYSLVKSCIFQHCWA